jgi:hypothetical protein
MAQFDSLIVFPLIWSLLLILSFLLYYLHRNVNSDFFGAKSLEKIFITSFQHFLRKIQKFKETLLTELFSK